MNKIIEELIKATKANRITWSEVNSCHYSFSLGGYTCEVYRYEITTTHTRYIFKINGVPKTDYSVAELFVVVESQFFSPAQEEYNGLLIKLLSQ